MDENDKVDWTDCDIVEVKAGILGGAPVVRGTRMPVDAIVGNFDYGVPIAEISEQFSIAEALIKSHRVAYSVC